MTTASWWGWTARPTARRRSAGHWMRRGPGRLGHAVFCWQIPFLSIPGAFDREELEQTYKKYVNEIVSAVAPSPDVPLATLVAEGDPAESLITAAGQAELLVVGTRGRSPFAGLVLGSVSQRCAAAAPCPVVLVKADGEQAG